MKLRPANGLLTFFTIGILLCIPLFSNAGVVESGYKGVSAVNIIYPDPDPAPGESDCKSPAKTNTPIVRDSTSQTKSIKSVAIPAKPIEKSQKTEEDPLSFNFLYYIIEKFKMSDMMQ